MSAGNTSTTRSLEIFWLWLSNPRPHCFSLMERDVLNKYLILLENIYG